MMKRVMYLLIVATLIASGASAQGVRAGIKAGANMNKVTGQSFDEGFDLSYHLGGFAEIDFNKKWGIQPELLWSQSRTMRSSGFNSIYPGIINPNGDQDIKLDYLAIPILLRYNVGNMLTLNAGPQFGILINQNDNLLQNGENAFKKGDFAMVLGAQLNFNFLRVYGRYNIGLQNINDIDNKDKWTNQQLQLGVGFRF